MVFIDQRLEVKDWPLKEVGDEHFFGYIVALGVFPQDWDDDKTFLFADFAYNDAYERYRLPCQFELIGKLHQHMSKNMWDHANGHGLYENLWIKLTSDGYDVTTP